MTYAQRMIETNPSGAAVDTGPLVECIQAYVDCAQSCTACAEACRRCESACNDVLTAV